MFQAGLTQFLIRITELELNDISDIRINLGRRKEWPGPTTDSDVVVGFIGSISIQLRHSKLCLSVLGLHTASTAIPGSAEPKRGRWCD